MAEIESIYTRNGYRCYCCMMDIKMYVYVNHVERSLTIYLKEYDIQVLSWEFSYFVQTIVVKTIDK